ncbi:hypothetical protein TRFO_42347 [Tritrichomonas foetus]|uniref:Nucleotide-diphospho-sugar transferase domain-containing protein n=1 Tax=Tritrichomonas foetus TaxID=1144522 RepID=A0A1J4L1A5_9EUKA|nr:hypothetical protein TRFO_42347 [Tritrichomonas foetus]|eukprot:OHT15742.1 hypothetical protein TRFO_42347 [Tritrichomonas foetus]
MSKIIIRRHIKNPGQFQIVSPLFIFWLLRIVASIIIEILFFQLFFHFFLKVKFFASFHETIPSHVLPQISYGLCVPFIKKESFSSRRDLTITFLVDQELHLALNLFSIRQSGCKASIVVITNQEMEFSTTAIKIMNCIEAKVVRSEFSPSFYFLMNDLKRTILIKNYLQLNIMLYDRVFYFDAFDVFFESDPFKFFNGDRLFFVQESTIKLKDQQCNKDWFLNAYDEETFESISDNLVVCSGTVAGTIKRMIQYYSVLLSLSSFRIHQLDQPQLNYIIYSGLLAKKKIPYTLFDHVGPIHTLNIGEKNYKYYFDDKRYLYVTNAAHQVAAVIHQTKNFPNILEGLYNRCNLTLYTRSCNCSDSKLDDEENAKIDTYE